MIFLTHDGNVGADHGSSSIRPCLPLVTPSLLMMLLPTDISCPLDVIPALMCHIRLMPHPLSSYVRLGEGVFTPRLLPTPCCVTATHLSLITTSTQSLAPLQNIFLNTLNIPLDKFLNIPLERIYFYQISWNFPY